MHVHTPYHTLFPDPDLSCADIIPESVLNFFYLFIAFLPYQTVSSIKPGISHISSYVCIIFNE